MGMTTSEMRTTFERWILGTRKQTQPFGLIERSGEGYFDLYTQKHWEGWQAALATPSVASPQAAWKDDALQSRINEAVDEANGVTAAPVGEPGRTPPTGLVNELEREIIRLNEELRLERFQFRLWRGAWLRHLGGYIVRKAHEIDGFGLRHEQQLKEEYERGVGDAKNAMACRDKWIEEVGKALAAPPAQGAPGTREALDREQLAKAIWDGEIAESILKKASPLGTTWAQWPEDSARQPYCQSTYRMADFIIKRLAQPGAPTKEGTCKEKLFS